MMIVSAILLLQGTSLTLAPVFQDHMVLQRGMKVPIWGRSASRAEVRVALGSIQRSTRADAAGRWRIDLPRLEASATSLELRASVAMGSQSVVVRDVLVGEVWIAAGQSNMEWPLRSMERGEEEVSNAGLPQLRLFNRPYAGQYAYARPFLESEAVQMTSESFFGGKWEVSSPATAAPMSAVAYIFGKRLLHELKVPIGIIHMGVGGSPAEAWVPTEALSRHPVLRALTAGDWLQNAFLDDWCRQRGRENLASLPTSSLPTEPNTPGGSNHPFKPGFLFEAGIESCAPFAIRGVIWYQGESNALTLRRVLQHEIMFPVLVEAWRKRWGQGTFPFLYCQISSIGTEGGYRSHYWPEFRDSQRRLLDVIPNAGMAVTSDLGDRADVHPRNKREVGERLARVALAQVYGQAIPYSGPNPRRVAWVRGSVEVEFGQAVRAKNAAGAIEGFEIAGSDAVFHPASARAQGHWIALTAQVAKPSAVRYGWQPYSTGNLIGDGGLPASTFELLIRGGPRLERFHWSELPSIPDREGFAAPFAGVSQGALIVAGGANFPGKKPWEGGTKVWYDSVFVLESRNSTWKHAGRLPKPIAYGLSFTDSTGVVCVGGGDAGGNYSDVFRLIYDRGEIKVQRLPPLPSPVANGCGAMVGRTIYVACGQARADPSPASSAIYRLNLAHQELAWERVDPLPGDARILAGAASLDGAFWVFGGAALDASADGTFVRRYLRDAYRFDPNKGWRRVVDLPHPVVAPPSPAATDAGGFWVLGGDDGSKAGFQPVDQHPGFLRTALRYDRKSGLWLERGEMPVARVTVPLVRWGRFWVIPNGEARPGVRSPEVWAVE